MKISELIKELESFKNEYGDIKVFCIDSDYGYIPKHLVLDTVCIENENDTDEEFDVCSLEL